MQNSIFDIFRDRCASTPDAPFLILPNDNLITYSDALSRTSQYANLFTELGVSAGDRIAVQVEKSSEALIIYLATLNIGGIYLPLNPAYPKNEVRYFLTDAEPTLFICRSEDELVMSELCLELRIPNILALDRHGGGSLSEMANHQSCHDLVCEQRSQDPAAILYTSGTTGRSKGATLSNSNLVANALTLWRFWGFEPKDRLLHALPIFHTHGLFVATNVTICAGSAMILLPKFDLDEIFRLMPNATVMMGVPTFYTRMLADPRFTRESLRHFRLFISGSAPLSVEVHKEFAERTGHVILERYGMTETNMITSNPYDGPRTPGTVGPPLPGVDVQIVDPVTSAVLPSGEIGMIEVRGPNVFKGYWRNPEKTAEEFRESGFFVTGDLGKIDQNGYVHIVGREKDLIISGGFNVYPAEVEAAIEKTLSISECAVVGAPHPDWGEGVVAVIQAREKPCDLSAIRSALASNLATYKQPNAIIYREELPRNAMGKVEKKILRQEVAEIFVNHKMQSPPEQHISEE